MHGAMCSSPCPSRQAGRLASAGSCACSVPAVPSSVSSTWAHVVETTCLGRSWGLLNHWDGVGQGPGSLTTFTREQGLGSLREQGWGLVLCCAPVSDQSPTRDKIHWEISVSTCEIDGKVGNRHPHKLQKASDHLPPLLGCHGPHWLPAHPGDTVSPCAHP